MSAIAAAAAVFNALIAPFSPLRQNRGIEREQDEVDMTIGETTTTMTTTTTTTTKAAATMTTTTMRMSAVMTEGDIGAQGRKRKSTEKPSTTQWGGKTRNAKAAMSDDDLYHYFQSSLVNLTACENVKCDCLRALNTPQTCSAVAHFLVWFERKSKFDQDCMLSDWYKYASTGGGKKNWYMLPFMANHHTTTAEDDTVKFVKGKKICTRGMLKVMHIGKSRMSSLIASSKSTGVPQVHKHTGRTAPNAVTNDERGIVLKLHFEYLLQLGEVRATRVTVTLVDGEHGHANREGTVDMVYLPTSFGFRPCYKRYMESLGYSVLCHPNGGIIVEGINGKAINCKEFVSLKTYCTFWKRHYPQLKVRHPVEDICQYCFIFANRHRYLANHSAMDVCIECDEDGDDINVIRPSALDDNDGNDGVNIDDDAVSPTDPNIPKNSECATATVAEEREVLLLECAIHIRMAHAQRSLYQVKVSEAIASAKAGAAHENRIYTFVVDYGQNMELPIYNFQQPGCTYYYSPLSVYNLGMVNHAHAYEDGVVKEHMYAHVYHEGVGKKGANNVASLIIKTLRQLNLLRDDLAGGELNIIFDNCSGQNKNNTVLKLAMFLKASGYFKHVNFIFLIVGHTKNAADRLFNSLKHEYRKKNLYTMETLLLALSVSDSVTVIPTLPEDFDNYDALFKDLFRNLSGKVKQNHIFACSADDQMDLRESDIIEHKTNTHKCWKTGRLLNAAQLKEHTLATLAKMECVGINPYKQVEMHFKYGPHVPEEWRNDVLFCPPDDKVMSMVKMEKSERSEFRAKLKKSKIAGMKARLETIAYYDDNGNDETAPDKLFVEEVRGVGHRQLE